MRAITRVVSVSLKETRELLHRPLLALTLILGPLAILVSFGVGSDATFYPPIAIVVVPPGQEKPRLLQEYQREFEESLTVTEYTSDLEYARRQLRRNRVDVVIVLPPAPYETIAGGEQARIQVLYNEIDPARRWLVPDFVRSMASGINREIFLQGAREQQQELDDSANELDLAVRVLDRTIAAVQRGNREEALEQLHLAQATVDRLEQILVRLGPEATALSLPVERARARLEMAEERLAQAESVLATPNPRPLSDRSDSRRRAATSRGFRQRWTDWGLSLPKWRSPHWRWTPSTPLRSSRA